MAPGSANMFHHIMKYLFSKFLDFVMEVSVGQEMTEVTKVTN